MTMNKIKELRELTGAGVMDCKNALKDSSGNILEAKALLVQKNIVKRTSRGHRAALEGLIGTYLHVGSRICTMVELNCETDFVSRSAEFQDFANALAIHIAAAKPRWISRDEVPSDDINTETNFIIASGVLDGKPENVKIKILTGQMNRFFKETCLMSQVYVKDNTKTIQDLYDALSVKIGERLVIKRFSRFEVGK